MATVRILAHARLDVIRLCDTLLDEDPNLVVRFRRAFEQTVARYARSPFLGSPYDLAPPAYPDLRFAKVGRFRKHLILYRPISGGIEVVRVVHASQDPNSLFADPDAP
jgi:plasmid stabilization system protein ParE